MTNTSALTHLAQQLSAQGYEIATANEIEKTEAKDLLANAKAKIVSKMQVDITDLQANAKRAKTACYRIKNNNAYIGVKYPNTYLQLDPSSKFLTIANATNDQIIATLNNLVNYVSSGQFDQVIQAAVNQQQEQAKARHAKRNAKPKANVSQSTPAVNDNAFPVVTLPNQSAENSAQLGVR